MNVVRSHGVSLVSLPATLAETLQASDISKIPDPIVIFDFEQVQQIKSVAVRSWIDGLLGLGASYYAFVRCHPMIVSQFNMMAKFSGNGQLVTFYAPYACPACGPFELLVDRRVPEEMRRAQAGESVPCPKCNQPSPFDDLPEVFFEYMSHAPPPNVPAAAERAISGELTSAPGPFRARKEIVGDLTIVPLAGGVDARVRLDRVLSGMSDDAVVTLRDVDQLAPDTRLEALFETPGLSVYVADIPYSLFSGLGAEQRRALSGRVVSVIGLGDCPYCAAKGGLCIDAHTKETRCEACDNATPAPVEVDTSLLAGEVSAKVRGWLALRRESRVGSPSLRGPALVAGKYQVERCIGRGGMGEVYLAKQIGPGGFEKLVVLKRIIPSGPHEAALTANLLREARLAARISHTNVVQVLEIGRDEDSFFVTMEYVKGADLRLIFRACADAEIEIPLEIACRIVGDISNALAVAHEGRDEDGTAYSIVHRDVSPENVLVSTDGVAKLSDFGLATPVSQLQQQRSNSSRQGKLRYMAPETLDGKATDARVDIFALGVVLFECLTLRHPFHAPSELDTLRGIVSGERPKASSLRPSCPAALDAIVARAMAIDVAARYRSADEMRDDLEKAMASLPAASSLTLARWLPPVLARAKQLSYAADTSVLTT